MYNYSERKFIGKPGGGIFQFNLAFSSASLAEFSQTPLLMQASQLHPLHINGVVVGNISDQTEYNQYNRFIFLADQTDGFDS